MNTQEKPNKQMSKRFKIITTLIVVAVICAALAVFMFSPGGQAGTGKIEVAVILPLSGKGASHGEYVRTGIEMFKKDHPASRLEVTIIDSESDPQKAISGFKQKLLLRKPSAAISVLSGVSDTLAPVAEENRILLIGVNTATDTFVKNYSWTQRINDRPVNHTAPLAQLSAKKFSRVGVIYSDDAFGQFCKTTFDSTFHQINKNDIIFEPFTPNDRDQNIVVQRLISKNPEAIFVAGYGQGYMSIFQALRTFNYKGQVLADINFSNPQVLFALGEVAEGVVFAAMGFNVTPPSTSDAASFLKSYQDSFKREPWLGSAFSYDALAILDHFVNTEKPLERQSFFAMREWSGIAAKLTFPTPGECQYVFQFVRRTAGKNVPIDLESLRP